MKNCPPAPCYLLYQDRCNKDNLTYSNSEKVDIVKLGGGEIDEKRKCVSESLLVVRGSGLIIPACSVQKSN